MSHSYEGALRGENGNGAAREELKSHAHDIAADFAELRKDVAKLAAAVGKAARTQASQAGSHVGHMSSDLKHRAADRLSDVEDRVRERPLAALGVSIGVGLLLGMFMSARR